MYALEQVNVIKATTSSCPIVNKNHGKALDVNLEIIKLNNGIVFMGSGFSF
jgi:hypothetical protein